MKHPFKSNVVKTVLTVLIILLVVKLSWVLIEIFLLSAAGVNHEEEAGSKSLYYRVKLTPNEAAAPSKRVVKPIAGSIKDIKLIAVYNASDTTVVTVEYKKKTHILERGDTLNGFVLEGGGSNYATFSKNEKFYRVDLVKKNRTAAFSSSITPVRKPQQKMPKKAPVSAEIEGEIVDAGDHRIVDRSLLDHYADNMDDIFKNIGITELKAGSKTTGFKVTFVRRGSPFAKLGLRRGDILKSINGVELSSYNAAFSAYKNIKDAENLTMVIIRGKKEMELEYEIN